jgi:hypothetical protein
MRDTKAAEVRQWAWAVYPATHKTWLTVCIGIDLCAHKARAETRTSDKAIDMCDHGRLLMEPACGHVARYLDAFGEDRFSKTSFQGHPLQREAPKTMGHPA